MRWLSPAVLRSLVPTVVALYCVLHAGVLLRCLGHTLVLLRCLRHTGVGLRCAGHTFVVLRCLGHTLVVLYNELSNQALIGPMLCASGSSVQCNVW